MPKHNKSQDNNSNGAFCISSRHAEKLFTEQKEQGNPRTAQKLQRQMKSKPDQAAELASE